MSSKPQCRSREKVERVVNTVVGESVVVRLKRVDTTKNRDVWVHKEVTFGQGRPRDHKETGVGAIGRLNVKTTVLVEERTDGTSQEETTQPDFTHDILPKVPNTGDVPLEVRGRNKGPV